MTADPFANIPNADDSLNGEFSPVKAQSASPAAEAELNWAALRVIATDDRARWRKLSAHKDDYWAGRADAAQAVLESMDTLERYKVPGLAEHTQAAPVPDLADALKRSLAEHTQAACDTIKAASDVTA